MEAHLIEDNIVGSAYERLIDYAMRTSDAFLLAFIDRGGKLTSKQAEIRCQLASYRVKTRHNLMWPGITYGLVEGGIIAEESFVDIYRTSEELLPFLYEVGGLFNWVRPYPEDLCFFRKGACWLSNTAHERVAEILCQTEEDTMLLPSIGMQYRRTPNCDPTMYIEEYTLD